MKHARFSHKNEWTKTPSTGLLKGRGSDETHVTQTQETSGQWDVQQHKQHFHSNLMTSLGLIGIICSNFKTEKMW